MKLTPAMSELVGAIIGDGNIYARKGFWVELTGDLNNDRGYIRKCIGPIVKKELNYNPHIFRRPNSLNLRIYSKEFVNYLKDLGIPTGEGKGKTVMIPTRICKDWSLTRNCIRGIIDTDGSVTFDKREAYLRPYPRIALHINNHNLRKQLGNILSTNNFNATISEKEGTLYLNGIEQIKLFLCKIGFSNMKHIRRLRKVYPELISLNIATPQ